MITTCQLDYIQLSMNYLETSQNAQWFDLKRAKREKSPLRNYRWQYRDVLTDVRMNTGHNISQKQLFILSGQSLDFLRRSEMLPDDTLIVQVLGDNKDVSVSRLDIALTQYIDEDGLYTVDNLLTDYQNGNVISKHTEYGAKSIQNAQNSANETLYIGDMKKRAKRGIFRAYDKGLEMDLDSYLISRFEIEERKKSAMATFGRIHREDVTIREAFKTRFDVKNDYFQQMINANDVILTRDKTNSATDDKLKHASVWKWLHEQVAPSLGKAIAQDVMSGIGHDDYDTFMKIAKRAFEDELKAIADNHG